MKGSWAQTGPKALALKERNLIAQSHPHQTELIIAQHQEQLKAHQWSD
jgi:hypothetical protein